MSADVTLRQRLAQRLGLLEVGGVKALGAPAVVRTRGKTLLPARMAFLVTSDPGIPYERRLVAA